MKIKMKEKEDPATPDKDNNKIEDEDERKSRTHQALPTNHVSKCSVSTRIFDAFGSFDTAVLLLLIISPYDLRTSVSFIIIL